LPLPSLPEPFQTAVALRFMSVFFKIEAKIELSCGNANQIILFANDIKDFLHLPLAHF
jgi:hypothetical protein